MQLIVSKGVKAIRETPIGTLHLYLCSPFGQACSFRCLSAAPPGYGSQRYSTGLVILLKIFESFHRLNSFYPFSFEGVKSTSINIRIVRVTYSNNATVIKNELSACEYVPSKDTTQSLIASPTEMRRAVVMLLLCVSPCTDIFSECEVQARKGRYSVLLYRRTKVVRSSWLDVEGL